MCHTGLGGILYTNEPAGAAGCRKIWLGLPALCSNGPGRAVEAGDYFGSAKASFSPSGGNMAKTFSVIEIDE